MFWEFQALCVAAPPFLALMVVRALVEGDYRVAAGISGLLCLVPLYFFYPYVAIKAFHARRPPRSAARPGPGEHRATTLPEPRRLPWDQA